MKKKLIIVAVLSLVLIFSANSMAQENDFLDFDLENREMMIGFDFPAVGWANYNKGGVIKGYKGINFGLGYTDKRYMEPGMKMGKMNTFWSWGTLSVIYPYAEVGIDYPFVINQEKDGFWTVTGSVGALVDMESPVTPFPRLGISYHF